ncbi:MAG: hypothetical protein ACI857_002195 [Arenicella sp.]|jgi:hypothetical protein
MHKGRITVAVIAVIGMLSLVFPWVEISKSGMESGFVFDFGMETWYGFQTWYGDLASVLFLVIGLVSVLGKREKMIAKGFPKMTILVASGLLLLEGILILIVAAISLKITAEAGVYLMMIAALATAAAPYLFKSDGTVGVPTLKEVADDIEDSADIVEDKVEDIADKFEETFDKDDKDDDDDKKEDNSSGEKAPEA